LKIPQAQHQRDTIRTDEYELIRDFIIEKEKDEYWSKFILMLKLQLKTGMRVGELVSIRNRNIDKKNKQIQIVGKGDRARKANFGDKTDKHIWESILSKMTDGIFLFYRTRVQYFPTLDKKIEIEIDKNKPTTTSYYSQRFREMRDEELKLRGKGVITSHSLRRYFITRFVKETGRRDLVRQIVGHTSTRMTDYYMGDLIETDTLTTIDIGV
jgi:integrase